MKPNFLILVFALIFGGSMSGQNQPFEIHLEPVAIPNLGGIQSYAFGQHNGKWLIVGGRLDGLHRRQPWASFDVAGHNNQLVVVDPSAKQTWTAPLTSLPAGIQEHLSATNPEFYQEGETLYVLGGYGFSASANDHITYPKLTAIKVSDVINAVINNQAYSSHFRQVTDSQFQVTGGKLKKINGVYHLLGGQKFMGKYNPMGPTHGPGFVQEYTSSIRKFTLADDGVNITINHLPGFVDSNALHRRDYNAEAQIMPNGSEGITMFSGVFQVGQDLPYLSSVTVDPNGYSVDAGFQQYYNHYHCPVLPLYSAYNNQMHTVFFGGIAQYYDNGGTLVQDNNVPFVNTIARVTRDSTGTMAEYKLPITMPTLLGAGAEFIPIEQIPQYNNRVMMLDSLTADSVLVGYIYGGISSSQPNIFFINDGTQSSASQQIFKVYLVNANSIGEHELNESSTSPLNLRVHSMNNENDLLVSFYLNKSDDVTLTVYDASGKILADKIASFNSEGDKQIRLPLKSSNRGILIVTFKSSQYETTRKVVF